MARDGEGGGAGALALGFTNTLGGARGGVTHETLHGFGDLVRWARAAGCLDASRALRIGSAAEVRPRAARAAHHQALLLREAIFEAVRAAVEGRPARASDRARIERAHAQATRRLVLVPRGRGGGYALVDALSADGPSDVVGPVVRDAVALLTDPGRLARVRVCEGATCTWLFVDPTKNGSRRWCEMKSCGNREKARRRRAREREVE